MLTRIGPKLVAGVVNSERSEERVEWHGIYIWYEVDGIYQRLGDMTFYEQADNSVKWDIYGWIGLQEVLQEQEGEYTFSSAARDHLLEQAENWRCLHRAPTHVSMLTIAPGIVWNAAAPKVT